jgi:hypothetical protein
MSATNKEIKRIIARATGAMGLRQYGTASISAHRQKSASSAPAEFARYNKLCFTFIMFTFTCVMNVLLYACETWTLRKKDKDSLLAFEMKCYRRILHIRWQQIITNGEVRRRADICRMKDNRLVKCVVFGMMD